MARDPTKLTKLDARTFAALQDRPLTAQQAGKVLHRSPNTALRSMQRLVLNELATVAEGERVGFATGTPAFVWTLVPGATFPGIAPRKRYTPQLTGAAEVDEELLPPVRIRRTGDVPESVAAKIGLAGLVAQVTR